MLFYNLGRLLHYIFEKIVVTFEKLVHFSLREIIYHLITLLDDKNDEVSCFSAIGEKQ